MYNAKFLPTEKTDHLRGRLGSLFSVRRKTIPHKQLFLDLTVTENDSLNLGPTATSSIQEFLDFISDCMPDGDIYLFGGILRDLALFGKKGFSSDIDIVVEGDWSNLRNYLEYLGAQRNKFGGYRLTVCGWPIDIWHARETWAVRQGLITYQDISSLTNSTVLNWDAILMNWRTKQFIMKKNYFKEITNRSLDIVLEKNPNPLGMAVRAFRHLCHKDAQEITSKAIKYLIDCTFKYSFKQIHESERQSYATPIIDEKIFHFFSKRSEVGITSNREKFSIAENIMFQELNLQVTS